MRQRPASLLLLLVLFGGAFAGVPLNFGDSNCGMAGGMDMDCCKAMLLQQNRTKFTRDEALLCAIVCAQNSTTLSSVVVQITPVVQTAQRAHLALTPRLPLPVLFSRSSAQTHSPPGSLPTYLRNLALLI